MYFSEFNFQVYVRSQNLWLNDGQLVPSSSKLNPKKQLKGICNTKIYFKKLDKRIFVLNDKNNLFLS